MEDPSQIVDILVDEVDDILNTKHSIPDKDSDDSPSLPYHNSHRELKSLKNIDKNNKKNSVNGRAHKLNTKSVLTIQTNKPVNNPPILHTRHSVKNVSSKPLPSLVVTQNQTSKLNSLAKPKNELG